jgi:hypothetical protein
MLANSLSSWSVRTAQNIFVIEENIWYHFGSTLSMLLTVAAKKDIFTVAIAA